MVPPLDPIDPSLYALLADHLLTLDLKVDPGILLHFLSKIGV